MGWQDVLHEANLASNNPASVPQTTKYTTTMLTSGNVRDQLQLSRSTARSPQDESPLLVLGVDGVLAPRRQPRSDDQWGDWRPVPGAQVRIPISPSMGQALAALPAERVFCSEWGTRADLLAEALGWGETKALRRELPSRWWWKLDALRAHLGARPRRPLAWVDAELSQHPEVAGWVLRAGVPSLLISPDPRTGLTASDIELLAAFCAENSYSSSEPALVVSDQYS